MSHGGSRALKIIALFTMVLTTKQMRRIYIFLTTFQLLYEERMIYQTLQDHSIIFCKYC